MSDVSPSSTQNLKAATSPRAFGLSQGTSLAAVAGLVSAIFSTISMHFLIMDSLAPVGPLPGIAFGAALAFVLYQTGLRDKFQLSFVLIFTLVVWIAAQNAALHLSTFLDQVIKNPSGDETIPDVWIVKNRTMVSSAVVYFLCGLIGGLGVYISTALVAGQLRTLGACCRLAATGALGSAAFVLVSVLIINHAFVLFLLWQVPIIFVIARELDQQSALNPS